MTIDHNQAPTSTSNPETTSPPTMGPADFRGQIDAVRAQGRHASPEQVHGQATSGESLVVGGDIVRSATPWINTMGGKIAATVAIFGSGIGLGAATGNIPNPFASDRVAAAPVVPGISAESANIAEYNDKNIVSFREKIDFASPILQGMTTEAAEFIHSHLITVGWDDYNYFTHPDDIKMPVGEQRPQEIAPASKNNTAQEIRNQIATKQIAVQLHPDPVVAQKLIPAITTTPMGAASLESAVVEKASRELPTVDIMNAFNESAFLDVNMPDSILETLPSNVRITILELRESGDGLGIKVSNNSLLVGDDNNRRNPDGTTRMYQYIDVLTQGNDPKNLEWSTFSAAQPGQMNFVSGDLRTLGNSSVQY